MLRPALRVTKSSSPFNITADLIVYGLTPGGISAAICAKRAGVRSVALVSGWRENRLGGMMTGGLGQTDVGNLSVIQGFPREVLKRIIAVDGQPAGIIPPYAFQPASARTVFNSLVLQAGIPVYHVRGIDGCDKIGSRITGFHTVDGYSVTGKVFVDATYEGDLIAFAGITYRTGREANALYGEHSNGTQYANASSHQTIPTNVNVDPYIVPGVPGSGLISGVTPVVSVNGAQDGLTQSYGFRLTLTATTANRRPFPNNPPPGYSPATYEGMARYLAALTAAGMNPNINNLIINNGLPNGKVDANNQGPFSTDMPGANTAYPEAGFNYTTNRRINYGVREQIWQAHINYTYGMWFWLRSSADPRIPASIVTFVKNNWLCLDEVNDPWPGDPVGFPAQLYVRESRCMVSDYVYTEADALRPNNVPAPYSDVIAPSSYPGDSHITSRYVAPNGFVQTEGGLFLSTGGADTVQLLPYSIMRPKQSECDNLLTTWSVSCSHSAFGGIRLETPSMALGQAAGNAAYLALNSGGTQIPVQQIPISTLQAMLVAQGVMLTLP